MTRGSTKTNSIKQLASRFADDKSGAVALMFAFAVIPLILAAGAAVDFHRVGSAKAEVQAALDASALAAAAAKPGTTETDRRRAALDTFEANLQGGLASKLAGMANVDFSDGNVTVSYDGKLPTLLLRAAGFLKNEFSATSTATINLPARAEIAMVLDYSSSMGKYSAGQKKYVTMRKAAIDMLNGLTDNGRNKEVKFGLVPFSHNVYTSLPGRFVLGAGGGNWTGCTYDRGYPFNTTSSRPGGNSKSKWGQPKPTDFGGYRGQSRYHCDGYDHNGRGYQANQLKVRALSSQHSATISQLQAMKPYGYTNISLGVEFGWHLLEPGAPFSARGHDDEKNKKFVVILTDGKQTTPAFGPGGSRDRFDGESNLSTLCTNIKAGEKITVITIAFALDDNATETRLRNCSSDPDKHFFKAESANDLTRAFEEIQQQIAKAVYLSK